MAAKPGADAAGAGADTASKESASVGGAAAATAPAGVAAAPIATADVEDPNTKERVNYMRYMSVFFIDGPSMYQSFFRAYLPRKTGKEWGEGQLWKSWCEENYLTAIKNYLSFKQQKRISDVINDKFIPIFEKGDISLFAHIIDKKVEDDDVREASEGLRIERNAIAHFKKTVSEFNDEKLHEDFEWLKETVVKKLFKDFPKLKLNWIDRLDLVRLGILDKDRLTKMEIEYEKLKRKIENFVIDMEKYFEGGLQLTRQFKDGLKIDDSCDDDENDNDSDNKTVHKDDDDSNEEEDVIRKEELPTLVTSSPKVESKSIDQSLPNPSLENELPTSVEKNSQFGREKLPPARDSPEPKLSQSKITKDTITLSTPQTSSAEPPSDEDETFQLPRPWTSPPILDPDYSSSSSVAETPEQMIPVTPPPKPPPKSPKPAAPPTPVGDESRVTNERLNQNLSAPPEINNDDNDNNNSIFSHPPQLISAPPIFKSLWPTAERFFIGEGFVAAEVDGRILIWGGGQKQPDNKRGEMRIFPNDVVFILKVDSLSWEKIKATGDVPPCTTYSAFAVLNKLTYIFGGGIGSFKETNKIHSLTLSGEFKRLIPTGDAPSSRRQLSGWSFEEKLYFFGGGGPKGKGGEWIESKNFPGNFYNNQLIEFDPKHNSFSQVITNGRSPSPRIFFAVAQLEEKVFIHGGWCNRPLDDFHLLNMKSKSWSSLSFDLPTVISAHTLSPISSTQLLLVGGDTRFGPSKKLYVVDVKDSKSSFVEDLPLEFCGEEEGLFGHRAIVVTKDKKAKSLICIGGWIDKNREKHPNHIIKFDLL